MEVPWFLCDPLVCRLPCPAASLSLPTLLSAQGTSGRVVGRVSDASGALLPGTKVTLVNEATNVSRDTTTNENGDYDFVEVPVGTYRLEFDLTGFKRNVRRGVSLDINQVITLNMTMQVGATQEVVDVTSEAPLVETTSTQLGAVVGDRAVSELPLNSRDTYQFLQLQPGVMSTVGSSNSIVYGSNNAGAVSVNGGRGRSNNFSVNGGDANDQFVNLPTVQPSPDSIAEFRVLTNTFDAEYGRNSGSSRQRGHEVGHQPVSRQHVRVLPEQGAQRQRLLLLRGRMPEATIQPEPVWRNFRRTDCEGPHLLLRFVRRTPHPTGNSVAGSDGAHAS